MTTNRNKLFMHLQAQSRTNSYVEGVAHVNPILEAKNEPLTDRSLQSITRNIDRTVNGEISPVSAHLSEVSTFARDGSDYARKGNYRQAGIAFFGVATNTAAALFSPGNCAKVSEHGPALRSESNFDLVDHIDADYNYPKMK